MKKTITIPQNRQSFTIPAPFPLVAGDVNAYEVVLPLPEAADGAQFTVQAKRANNQVVTDTVQISGAEARYTLKSNMYDIAGSLFLRLQVVQDGSILSECQLDCEVLEAYGSDVTADDRLPVLSSAIVQTQEATAAASTAAQAANEAAEAANAAAQEAEGVAGRVTALENNTTLIQNSGGGFAAGTDSEAGQGAAVGYGASADNGGAAGRKAFATSGGAVGYLAAATKGGAAGQSAVTDIGGAVGANAKAGAGFAGGSDAKAVDSNDNGIDAIQLGTGTNSTPKTLQVYGHQLLDANGKIPKERLREEGGGFAAGEGSSAGAGGAIGDSAIATTGGAAGENAETSTGFAGGAGAESVTGGAVGAGANVTTGGAAGSGAFTTTGGAVGTESSSTAGGGAIGGNTWTTSGGAVGNNARADYGGAVGSNANASYGGAVGANSKANNGGAIGNNAVSGDGFAGGNNAKAVDSSGIGIDAIQLGIGTNNTPKTLQVYGHQLLDANGKIPDARLNDAPSDGKLYGRKNSNWEVVASGLTDAPSDGSAYARKDGGWEELTDLHTHANKAILDATEVAYTESDQARIGTLENDLDGLYAQVGELESTAVTDAPSDGNTYARKDGTWTNLTRQIAKQLINFVPLEYDGSDVTDLDNLPSGITIVNYADGPGYGGYMVMTSLEGSGYGYQIKISIEGLSYRYNNGTWGSWIKIG